MPVDYLAAHLDGAHISRLGAARVGIAGAGGLGSNCAMMLARSGIRRFILVDGDSVEISNLNRQFYFPRHVGLPKVRALAEIMAEFDPRIEVEARRQRLAPEDIGALLPEADIWVEAFDGVAMKLAFMREALRAGKFAVGASGLAGWGGPPMLKRIIRDENGGMRAALVGDGRTGTSEHNPPMAPRVIQAAAMQADLVLEHILNPVAAMPAQSFSRENHNG